MIRIIKQSKKIAKVTCNNCESILAYDKTDIEVGHGVRYIKCPNCGEDINIDHSKQEGRFI